MTTTDTRRTAEALRTGLLVLPTDPTYDEARRAWNLAVDQRPAAVAVPTSVEEVQQVVRAAADLGLRVAPQSSGHGAAALAATPLDDTLLLRLHGLTGVTVDPQERVAHVVGGTLWADVVAAAAEHGLAALHGAPDVAVAGYTLGGGLSPYGRRHGLAASWVRGLDVVTADGSLVRADATREPDLFWALRGAGANVGIVVGIDLGLVPVRDVHAGAMLWPVERATEVLEAWARLTTGAPDSLTSTLRLMNFPDVPELPPFLAGRQVVVVDAAVLETDEKAAALLAPLRGLAPELDTFGRIPASALPAVHMDPPGPTPSVSEHAVLGPLDRDAVAVLTQSFDGPGTSPLMLVELRQLGGALAERPEGAGAVGHLPGHYSVLALGAPRSIEEAAAVRAAAAEVVRRLAPWSLPHRILNFTERAVDTSTGVDADSWTRLHDVRNRYDPQRRLRANHAL